MVARRVLVDTSGPLRLNVVEGKEGGALVVEGKIGHCDIPTANGRVYPRSIMEREIKRLKPRIEQASVYAAVDHPGDGKCLGPGTPVLMADGRVLPVEQIATGDRLMGPDGKSRTVLSTNVGRGPLYRIDPIKGEPWVCNDVHMLTLVNTDSDKVIDIPLDKWLASAPYFQSRHKQFSVGIDTFEDGSVEQKIDPYFLGVWFGDGSKSTRTVGDGAVIRGVEISKPDKEIKAICQEMAETWELQVKESDTDRCPRYALVAERGQDNRLLRTLRDVVGTDIKVPDSILRGSKLHRLAFLAGFLDTDGNLHHNCFTITQKREDWARAVCHVARSLGFCSTVSTRTAKDQHGTSGTYFVVSISGDVDQIPTRIERKKAESRQQKKIATRTGFAVTEIGEGDYYGFTLDGDGRFLLGDFTVTHNTRLKDAGAIVRDLWVESNGAIHGRFEVVEEAPAGKAVAAFLRKGAAVGMSSRGLGSTTSGPNGNDIVGEDFRLNTWDFVSDPACHDAYPAIMSEDEEQKITEDHLRARFPKLVKAIEEKAYQTAQSVCEDIERDEIRAEVEKQAEEALKLASTKIREDVKLEVTNEIRAQLREDFATKLVRAVAEMREQITEEVKSDLSSDPSIAGAKITLQKISEMLSPYKPALDVQKMLDEKDGTSSVLQKKLVALEAEAKKRQIALEQETKKKDEAISKLEQHGRRLAFALYVEQQIAGRQDGEVVKKLVGSLEQIASVDELQKKVASAIAEADKTRASVAAQADAEITSIKADYERRLRHERAEADRSKKLLGDIVSRVESIESSFKKVIIEKDAEIAKARQALAEQDERMAEALEETERTALLAYASQRTLGHKQAPKVFKAITEGRITSRDEVDRLASKLEEGAQEPGGVRERVRRAMSRGRETMTEDERKEAEVAEASDLQETGEAASDLRSVGINLSEAVALTGNVRPARR
jgi:hypothetical protein